MSKIVDIEKLKKEIERLDNIYLERGQYDQRGALYEINLFLDALPEENQEDADLLDKAIYWFKVIAEDMERLTSGNLPHNAAIIKGRAIHAYEYLEKHRNEADSKDCPKWVARDKDGCIAMYNTKPFKQSNQWLPSNGGDMVAELPNDLFPEITWNDEEPTKLSLIKKIV